MSQRNELLAVILIVSIALISENFSRKYPLYIIYFGVSALSLLQLVYVIPLCLWLINQGQISVMKGVVIAAIITFLVNGGCFLLINGGNIMS